MDVLGWLAHGADAAVEHPHSRAYVLFGLAAFVAVAGLVNWWRVRRSIKARTASVRRKSQLPDLDRQRRRNSAVAAAVCVVALALGAYGVVLYGQEPPLVKEQQALVGDVSTPEPGDDYALRFVRTDPDGAFTFKVSNHTPKEVVVQCEIDVLGADGRSVATGEFLRIDQKGRERPTDVYTTLLPLEPNGALEVEVGLDVSAPAERWDGSCERVE